MLANFHSLTPDQVLEGVERAGFVTTGRYIQLNSYENRVFDLFLEPEDNDPTLNGRVVAKFYRPGRWTREAIKEEHDFLTELGNNGIPAVAPLKLNNGDTIFKFLGMYISVFPKNFGRMPEELSAQDLTQVGRTLARLHNVGEQSKGQHRPTLHSENYGWKVLEEILPKWVAPEVWSRYQNAAEDILHFLDENLDPESYIRIHGDCHRGNLLKSDIKGADQEFFFVDFDDFCNGPVVQDFWMLFSSDESSNQEERDALLRGYEELRKFDDRQLLIMPGLRGLRIIHYAGWIARRWDDPSFPNLFPNFRDYTYWAEEVESLERIAWSLEN